MTLSKYGIECFPIYTEEHLMTMLTHTDDQNIGRIINRTNYDTDTDRWTFRWGLNKLMSIIIEGNEEEIILLKMVGTSSKTWITEKRMACSFYC